MAGAVWLIDTPIGVPVAELRVTHGHEADAVKFATLLSLVLTVKVCCKGAAPPEELNVRIDGLTSRVGPNIVSVIVRF